MADYPVCAYCSNNHITSECPSSIGIRYRRRMERLKRFIELDAPFQIVANECILVLVATIAFENPSLNLDNSTDRFKIYEKLAKKILDESLDNAEAVNQETAPM